ncbi:hypothetical protein DM2_2854 [Halorubrum sp. DM2]|nr:hypothetical protein DM2_2854 [Halorubrum sp. DM2]
MRVRLIGVRTVCLPDGKTIGVDHDIRCVAEWVTDSRHRRFPWTPITVGTWRKSSPHPFVSGGNPGWGVGGRWSVDGGRCTNSKY